MCGHSHSRVSAAAFSAGPQFSAVFFSCVSRPQCRVEDRRVCRDSSGSPFNARIFRLATHRTYEAPRRYVVYSYTWYTV